MSVLRDLAMSSLKSNYSNGTWSEETVITYANKYLSKSVFTDDDITELEEYINPTETEDTTE